MRMKQRLIQVKAMAMRWLCSKVKVEFSPANVSSILVMRYDRIGDMVVTTPLFQALKKGFPNAEISVLASQSNTAVIRNNPHVDQVYVLPKAIIPRVMTLMRLRCKKISLLVELEHNLIWHQIIHTRLINPTWVATSFKCDRYGVDAHSLSLYDVMAEVRPNNPMVEIYLGISAALGVPRVQGDERYQLVFDRENLEYAEHYTDASKFLVGFNFFGSKKGWELSATDFHKLCDNLFSVRSNLKVIVFTTQETLSKVKRMVSAVGMPSITVVAPTSDVMDAAALISKLNLLITPDTSFTHIACAFDVPLVTVNPKGEEVFQNWKPIHPSGRAKAVFSKESKSLTGYSYDELECAIKTYLPVAPA